MKSIESIGEKIFNVINCIILAMLAMIMLYPFIYTLVASLSNPDAVTAGKVWFWPAGFELTSYGKVLGQKSIWTSYGNTIFYAVVGTVVNIIVTTLGAYALSKKRLKGRNLIMGMILVTLWFPPGIIPFYLNLRNLHLLDTRLAIIIAFACQAYYVVLMRTFFASIDDSMEESAKIDGANDWTILFRIFIPLSTPMLMTIGLYYFVDRWNGYFWAMILFKEEYKMPLQVVLRKLIVLMSMSSDLAMTMDNSSYSEQTVIYATIMVSVLPMIMLYPFIQRFFVKGMMIGAVKG